MSSSLQQTSAEEISAAAQQPTCNVSLLHHSSGKHTEVISDEPSDHEKLLPVEIQDDIDVPQRGRKHRRSSPIPQQRECAQGKDKVPLRPLRRKDGLTPDRTQKTEIITVECVKKDTTDETIPTPSASDVFSHSKKGDDGLSQGVAQNVQAQESVTAQVMGHKDEGESVKTSVDLVPPRRVKRRDTSLPPEAPKKAEVLPRLEAPRKPLRRKGSIPRGTSGPVTDDQQNLKAPDSSALRAFGPVPPDLYLRGSDASGSPEPSMNIDEPSQTPTELICSQPVEREDQTTKEQETDTDGRSSSLTPPEMSKKDSDCQTSSEFPPDLSTKGRDAITPKPEPEPELHVVEETTPVSIIKKILLPQRSKKLSPSKPGNMDSEKESIIPALTRNTQMDMGEMKQSQVDVMIKVTSSQKSEDTMSDVEMDQTSQPVLRLPAKKPLGGSFPDDFRAMEAISLQPDVSTPAQALGTGSHSPAPSSAVEAVIHQHGATNGSLPPLYPADQPSASPEEAAAPVRMRRSRQKVEEGESSLPVPKPRVKKRLSGSFPDNLSDTVIDTTARGTFQQRDRSSSPVALPRHKERLGATCSDGTPPADRLFPADMESSVSSQEVKEGSASLDSSVISEGFVAIPGTDVVASELEQEVSVCLGEMDFPQAEDISSDIVTEDWTFTDKPAPGHSERADAVSSAQDDWLHVEESKVSESMEGNWRKETRDEEADFDFVSVDVAAGCLEGER